MRTERSWKLWFFLLIPYSKCKFWGQNFYKRGRNVILVIFMKGQNFNFKYSTENLGLIHELWNNTGNYWFNFKFFWSIILNVGLEARFSAVFIKYRRYDLNTLKWDFVMKNMKEYIFGFQNPRNTILESSLSFFIFLSSLSSLLFSLPETPTAPTIFGIVQARSGHLHCQ